ncbi:hypothetical protein GCM10007368_10890 [Isoptericola cucumis]|uniref:DUF2599 domain-containing protein n=1 Tax=Isoptericola cucumis TaxID=1776856 RepID=A0ABQ2B4M4_9MICO|nr:hypothetical protein GCM10007368_10890 [Isoptericola cucumis]
MLTPPLLAALALGACSPADPAPDRTPPPTTATSPATPTPTPESVRVSAGAVTLEATVPASAAGDPAVQVSPARDDGTATMTLRPGTLVEETPSGVEPTPGGTPDPPAPLVTLTSPGAFATHPDGSVTVLDDGVPVGGLTAPRGARLVAVDDTRLEVRAAGDEPPDEVTTVLGTAGVSGADWGEREGGRSLAVTPSDWTREAGQAGVDVAWAELTASDPEVDTATMRDQLECHAIGAPDKATWNLEPWRPDVGLLATMAARCNPTS